MAALPPMKQNDALVGPASPPVGATNTTKRRAHDAPKLRRVKDSREQLKKRKGARAASAGAFDTTTTASTAAGRSYTVGNVHHGVIYLRPVVRPGNQRTRSQASPFVFPPQTPPDSATLPSQPRPVSSDWEQSAYAPKTLRSEPTPPLPEVKSGNAFKQPQPHPHPRPQPTNLTSLALPITHGRSQSFSTIDEHTITSVSHEPGTFRVVIERPSHSRPKTADTITYPVLEVPIPHYRLGTPHFTALGAADLRSSVYTRASGTTDLASSLLTLPRATTHSFLSSRPRSDAYSPIPQRYRATMDRPPLPNPVTSSSRVSTSPIGPRLYDALALNPDDRSVVRFSSTGEILAATPSRLVAHITSPNFLDYELLSDFFLTFRAFLCTKDLVAYLISRLQWAVERQDDFGRIVRVRTFVALRHWILNYFVDDFVPSYELRIYFCKLVNSLHNNLQDRADGGGGDIKIVGELKKCWRRTCAQYWKSEQAIGSNFADEALLPGGHAGPIDHVEETPDVTAPLAAPLASPSRQTIRYTKETIGSNPSDHFTSQHMEWAETPRKTPHNSVSQPPVQPAGSEAFPVPLSPASELSMHVLSCSIPMLGMSKQDQAAILPTYPHPVPAGRFRPGHNPQPSTSTKLPNSPGHSHKRSGSFSDALRDSRAPLSISKFPLAELAISAVTNVPGSLVRGGLFQPGSPFFEIKSLRTTRSQPAWEAEDPFVNEPHKAGTRYKFMGTVRRALSVRQPLNAGGHSTGPTPQRSSPSRASNPASVSAGSLGNQKKRVPRSRLQVRVDLLASTVEESFKRAIDDQVEKEAQQFRDGNPPELGGFEFEAENRGTTTLDRAKPAKYEQSRAYSNITTGSKSILIIDDTRPPPLPIMSGAMPIDIENIAPDALVSAQDEPYTLTLGEIADKHAVSQAQSTITPSISGCEPSKGQEQHDSGAAWRRPSTALRRSLSEGRKQMHSFRRRGSTKKSMSRSGSLRRHASHNSILSRSQRTESFATYQSMSSNNDPFFLDRPLTESAKLPRQLRRRPGGDLRAADNVHDLEVIPRPHSTGSVSNHTHSVTNSVILRSDRFIDTPVGGDRQTEHGTESGLVKKPMSLVATHSSQPNLRPSFEVEVAKLAALPDDVEDDGGIESALMKLEGRFEKRSPSPPRWTTTDFEFYRPTGAPAHAKRAASSDPGTIHGPDHTSRHSQIPPDWDESTSFAEFEPTSPCPVPTSISVGESTGSYSSTPLLDRGMSQIATPHQAYSLGSTINSLKPLPLDLSRIDNTGSVPLEITTDNAIFKKTLLDSVRLNPPEPRGSFLLDEDENLSDHDTTTHAISGKTSPVVRSFFDDKHDTPDPDADILPMHPMRHPPTPPATAHHVNDPLPGPPVFPRGPLDPSLQPSSPGPKNSGFGQMDLSAGSSVESHGVQSDRITPPPTASHLPFVLAYDSELLAQQMTIVEKDALDEIDWKELIELRWKQTSLQIRDWVQYLQTQEVRGVDVVISRFNLVVKWIVSECILTDSMEERARCISKYIHIATQARRIRNYATMYQIAIALISNDVSRLRKTWALVPAADAQTMKELEVLVQPLRNFYNLRMEMETATVEEGCIPFIGIYTRDLIYNAQKPAFIDAPPVGGERLVNFERHHTAATIVKNLLRLLEASSKYNFRVEPNVISKCLWIATLSDEELTRRSRLCE